MSARIINEDPESASLNAADLSCPNARYLPNIGSQTIISPSRMQLRTRERSASGLHQKYPYTLVDVVSERRIDEWRQTTLSDVGAIEVAVILCFPVRQKSVSRVSHSLLDTRTSSNKSTLFHAYAAGSARHPVFPRSKRAYWASIWRSRPSPACHCVCTAEARTSGRA